MTRFVPHKSLLVLGLLVTVLGSSAAAAFAAAQPPTAATQHITVTAALHPASAQYETATSATVLPAVTTAYSGVLLHPAGTVPVGPAPLTSAPGLEPAGICSVPGVGSIVNLFGFCTSGSSSPGLLGGLNNICSPSLPQPEPASGGIDSIVRPPATAAGQGKTLYDSYGVSGQFWAPYNLNCSDMTSLIGNNVAGMVFDASKAVDRVTITVYQSAAGNGILSWLANVVNRLITSLGNAIYFPYLAPVVLLGVMWLAWHGLIRKRATRTIEGTIWMVIACAAAIWLIGRPADFTGFGQSVSNGVTQVLNVAFSKLPSPGQTSCVPVAHGDPQSPAGGNYSFVQGNGMVDQNANQLWTVLVCKPWLDGEFGTTQYSATKTGQTPVNQYGRQLLWSQAIAANENPTSSLIQAKQSAYAGIASSIKQNDPSVYPLFQGNQWTSRLEIGFAALFAALVAGVLILLIAVTLIILKLGFLLLLIAGPFFLIVGTHPGFGRVVAVRWVEMIIGVLLKQVAVALVLSILLYAYSLIMGTSDTVLPWALKILMIALVTIAVFIYRKPFQHLFASVGYSSNERRQEEYRRSRELFRTGTLSAAAAASGFAGARLGRWSRRDAGGATALADHIAAAGGATVADPELAAGQHGVMVGATANGHSVADASGEAVDADGQPAGAGVRATAGGNGRAWAAADTDGAARAAPPLHLPSRHARGGEAAAAAPSGWARGTSEGTGAGRPQSRASDAPPRTVTPGGASIGASAARPSLPSAAARQAPARPATPGQPPARQTQPGHAPARRPEAAPPPASRAAGPPPRTTASGPGPAQPSSAPRARWRDEAAAPRPAPEARGGGRPLWRPGPIRSSSGWSGGSGAASAPAAPPPPQAPPPRSAPPQRSAPPGRSAPASRPPAPRPAAPPPSSRQAAAPQPYSGPAPRPSGPWNRPANGGQGQPARGNGQNGGEQAGSPRPFWLRPVRRKK